MNLTWPEQHTYDIPLSLSFFPEFLSLLFLTTPHNFTQFVSLVTSITTPELVSLFSFFIQRFLLFQILYISKMTKSTNKRNTLLSIETVVRENVCWLTIKILYIYIYIYIKVYNDITVFPVTYINNSPPSAREYISYNLSLLHNKAKWASHKNLVNISTIWTLVETDGVAITPSSTFSQVIWQYTSIYLVHL